MIVASPLMRRLIAVGIALAACCAPAHAATSKGFHFAKVGTGFPEAVYVTSAPNDATTLYVVEQSGRIVLARGGVPAGTFLDIHSEVLDSGEQGLVGFAFSPAYASDHTFYVDYVATNGDTHISKFTADQGVAVPASEQQLLDVQQPFVNHKGGMLAFDKRGRLWAGLGDGGTDDNATYGDQVGRAQNMGVLLGKLLRLDTRTPGATWQIAALGVRNPYRFSFDRQTGDLWLVDPGTHLWEEIDFRTAAQLDTLWNFGWDHFEGPIVYNPHMATTAGTLVRPWYSFQWGIRGACATIGGYVYRGKKVAAARGRYFYGDYCSGWILSLKRDAKGHPSNLLRTKGIAEQLTSFGEDANGELYAVTATGDLYALAAG
jgi:glucose/arabinose dehydrogenase